MPYNEFVKRFPYQRRVLLTSVVICAAVLIAFPLVTRPHTIAIYSETIALLVEHEHKNLDSIVDLHHGESVGTAGGIYVLPEDTWITGFTWEIENAPRSTLHHLVVTRDDKPAILCANGASAYEEIFTIGSDTESNELMYPRGYAMFLPKGTPLSIDVMFHNPEPPFGPGGNRENVRLKLTLHRGNAGSAYKRVSVVRLSVEDPACTPRSGTFDVPAHAQHYVKTMQSPIAAYTFKNEARLLMIVGHTHGWDGAGALRFFLNGALNEELMPRLATKDLWSWVTGTKYLNQEVQSGDTISISSEYSNPHAEPLIHEAMGMMLVVFSEEE